MPDLVVYSKSDLLDKREAAGSPALCHSREGENLKMPASAGMTNNERHEARDGSAVLRVSSKTDEGLEALTEAMNTRLFANRDESEDIWITSEREKTCLEEALAGIDRTLSLIRTNPAVELIAFEMQLVRRALQSITGEISSEDVLQKIFAGFCIGK